MAALSGFDDETGRELAAARAHADRLTHHIARIRGRGVADDAPWLRKLGWQLEACRVWVRRLEGRVDGGA